MMIFDKILSFLLPKDFQDEAIGDLWELQDSLKRSGKRGIAMNLILLKASFSILLASWRISRQEIDEIYLFEKDVYRDCDYKDEDENHGEERADQSLFAGLVGLNILSGATTIQGMCQIITGPAGWVGGFAIQSILLMLSTDKAGRHAPIRKWLAMGVLTSVSIYTSFFSYYALMTQDKNAQNAAVDFLAPINKLKQGDRAAAVALSIASLVDGMIILLATAITIKKRNSKAPIHDFTKRITQILIDIKVFSRIMYNMSNQVVGSMPISDFIDTTRLENSTHLVSFHLRGRGSHFLTTLYFALDSETRILNHQILLNHPDPTYRLGYRMMLDELRRLRWIVWNRKQRNFLAPTQSCYIALTTWLNAEMLRQAKEESRLEAEGVTTVDAPERAIILHFPRV